MIYLVLSEKNLLEDHRVMNNSDRDYGQMIQDLGVKLTNCQEAYSGLIRATNISDWSHGIQQVFQALELGLTPNQITVTPKEYTELQTILKQTQQQLSESASRELRSYFSRFLGVRL